MDLCFLCFLCFIFILLYFFILFFFSASYYIFLQIPFRYPFGTLQFILSFWNHFIFYLNIV